MHDRLAALVNIEDWGKTHLPCRKKSYTVNHKNHIMPQATVRSVLLKTLQHLLFVTCDSHQNLGITFHAVKAHSSNVKQLFACVNVWLTTVRYHLQHCATLWTHASQGQDQKRKDDKECDLKHYGRCSIHMISFAF